MYKCREKERTHVVIILLHGNNPGNVVEGDSANTEVLVVGNFADLLNKAVQIWSRDAVHSSEEVGRCKTVVVSGGTTALKNSVSGTQMDVTKVSILTLALT